MDEIGSRWMHRRTTRRAFVKRAAALGVAVSGVAGLIAACSGLPSAVQSPPSQPTAGPATAAPAAASGGGRASVVLWHSLSEPLNSRLNEQVQAFNEAQQAVTVSTEQRGKDYHELHQNVWLASIGNAPRPDLVLTATTAQMAKIHLLQPLDEPLKKAGVDLNDFVPGLLSDCQYQEQLMALPASRSTPVCFYNAAMFADVGVEPSTYFASWANVATEGVKFLKKEGGETVRCAHGDPPAAWFWQQKIMAFGGDLGDVDDNLLFSQGPAVEALQFWQDAIYRHGVMRRNTTVEGFNAWDENADALFSLRLAVSSQSTARLTAMIGRERELWKTYAEQGLTPEQYPFRLGVAPMPGMRTRAVPYGGANLALLASSTVQDAALRFMTWFTSPEGTARWHLATGYLPVRVSAQKLPEVQGRFVADPRYVVAVDQLAIARPTPLFALLPKFELLIAKPLLEKVLINPGDVRTSLDKAVKDMTDPTSEYNKTTGG